jgi:hypothetical protein
MGIFGWSYPPGAANDPNAPWNQVEGPCDVCGKSVDDCICPECPVCHSNGDPDCYVKHGLEKSDEQVESLAKALAEQEAANAAEDEKYEALYRDYKGDES